MTSKPARLAFTINSLAGGGAERVLSTLLCEMANHVGAAPMPEIHLILLDDEAQEYPVPDFVVRHKLACGGKFLTSVRRLHGCLKSIAPDVSVSFLSRANCANVLACRQLNIASIISERANTSQHFSNGLAGRLNRLLVRLFYPLADTVVAVSGGVADDLCANYGVREERLHVIYNPFRFDVIQQRAAQAPGLALPEKYFVNVGRLVANKNHALLIEAYRQAQPAQPLVILGEGEERPRLEALVKAYGLQNRVHLPGFVDNPYAVLAGASCFVSSSNVEGFPNGLVEAMALGLPVIATDCHSGPAEILHGVNKLNPSAVFYARHGILLPCNDSQALATALGLLDDASKLERLGEAARLRARDFSVERAVKAYIALINATFSNAVPALASLSETRS